MIRLVVALMLAFAPAAALAQQEQVRLRAGEHSGYSRVVLDISALGEWSSDRDGRRLTLRFNGRDIEFDTRQVYPARRVTRVLRAEGMQKDGDSLLTLALACDCETKIFTLGQRKLVIDVLDKDEVVAAPESATNANTNPSSREARNATLSRVPQPAPRPRVLSAENELGELVAATAPEISAPIPAKEPAAPITEPIAEAAEPMADAATPAAAEADAEAAQVDVAAARRLLLEQLTRAAEQGLLEFRPMEPALNGVNETPPETSAAKEGAQALAVEDAAKDVAEAPSSEHHAEATRPAAAGDSGTSTAEAKTGVAGADAKSTLLDLQAPEDVSQIAARSVFDRDKMVTRGGVVEIGDFCVSDRHLDVASWAEDAPMADQIPLLRTRLLGEFDKVDGEATLALARLYIHFGFGAEAESVLRALEDGGARDEIREVAILLIDIARIVDGREPSPEGPVVKSDKCSGRINVWRIAAGLGSAPPDLAALEAVLTQSPIHIRRALAPRIVEAMLDRGEVAAAARMHGLLARAEGDHGDAFRLAEARLAGAEGRVAVAEGGYSALIASNSIMTDRALLHLSDSLLARGAPAPPRLVGDLEAMAFLLRGTPLGRKLRVAEVRLRAGDGALLPTMTRIGLDMARDPAAAGDLRHAAQDIWREARAADMAPADYARSAILHMNLVGAAPEADPARVAAAGELISIGLPNLAIDALAPPLSRGSSAARRAAARAFLDMQDAARALDVLAEEDGDEVQLLRARAYELEGAYSAAFAALAESESGAAKAIRAAVAWRGGDWSAAAALTDNPDRHAMASFMNGREAPIDTPPSQQVTAFADQASTGNEALDAVAANTARSRFSARSAFVTVPSLSEARRALDLAEGARNFLQEVLKDG